LPVVLDLVFEQIVIVTIVYEFSAVDKERDENRTVEVVYWPEGGGEGGGYNMSLVWAVSTRKGRVPKDEGHFFEEKEKEEKN
jgi:hypothetical protein